jgi:hypothetical protein
VQECCHSTATAAISRTCRADNTKLKETVMGERAHIVVKDGGRYQAHYSQWAGADLELDLLAGPEAARRFAQAQLVDADQNWQPFIFYSGGALLDFDRRHLVWFAGCHGDYAYRQAVCRVLARTWPGWHVEWAYNGMATVLASLGLDTVPHRTIRHLDVPPEMREPGEFMRMMPSFRLNPEIYPPGSQLPAQLLLWPTELRSYDTAREVKFWADYPDEGKNQPGGADAAATFRSRGTLVTIADGTSVRAYLADNLAGEVITHGAAALPRYAAWPQVRECPWMPRSGLHVDTRARTAGVWTSGHLEEELDVDAGAWPGWQLELWQDRYREQLGRSGDVVRLPPVDRARGLRRLAAEFAAHQDFDAGTKGAFLVAGIGDMLESAARSAGLTMQRVASHAFDHMPVDLPSADAEIVSAVIADLMAGHGGPAGSAS